MKKSDMDRFEKRVFFNTTYRGVRCEIQSLDPLMKRETIEKLQSENPDLFKDDKMMTSRRWVAYIYIDLANLDDKELAEKLWLPMVEYDLGGRKRKTYNYSEDLLGDLPFHGGITYYGKELGYEESKIIKVGCDYQHWGDTEVERTPETIFSDLRSVIDYFHECVVYKLDCCRTGGAFYESQGEYADGEKKTFYSKLPSIPLLVEEGSGS